jgi:hypothetical protein
MIDWTKILKWLLWLGLIAMSLEFIFRGSRWLGGGSYF